MSKLLQVKLGGAVSVIMVAIALLRPHPNALIYAVLAIGVINALVPLRGTAWVRAFAVAGTLIALIWPPTLGAVVFFDWIVWAPGYVIAVMHAGSIAQRDGTPTAETDAAATSWAARSSVAAIIIAVAIASIVYRWLGTHHLQQSAALFVGIPTVLALAVVFLASPRSAVGVAMKATTIGLLVSGLFLGEGMLCILMAAPLFYAVAGLIGAGIDEQRRINTEGYRNNRLFSGLFLLALAPMSLEGVTDFTTINRHESITESRIVHASSEAVTRALFDAPRFDRVRPAYLQSGFPSAIATRIERGSSGTRWVIAMRGGEMRVNGMEPRTGDLVLALEESRPGLLRWRAISDSSHMTHFLNWRESIVRWEAIDGQTTKVTWTLNYDRGLDPAWYFGPMERYAVHLAAGYLIDAVATP